MVHQDVLVRQSAGARIGAVLLARPMNNLRVLTRQDPQDPNLYKVILEILSAEGELKQVLLLTRTFSHTPDKQVWFPDKELRYLTMWIAQIARGEEEGNSRLFSGAVAAGNFYIVDMRAVMLLEARVSIKSAFEDFLEKLQYD